jgi:hypothetical protein
MQLTLAIRYLVSQGIRPLPLTAVDQSTSLVKPTRTKSGIVWSCLVTIFTCTWVSVHPNIPGPEANWYMKTFLRARLVVVAPLVPELVITWAMRQWIVAYKLGCQYRSGVPACIYELEVDR